MSAHCATCSCGAATPAAPPRRTCHINVDSDHPCTVCGAPFNDDADLARAAFKAATLIQIGPNDWLDTRPIDFGPPDWWMLPHAPEPDERRYLNGREQIVVVKPCICPLAADHPLHSPSPTPSPEVVG